MAGLAAQPAIAKGQHRTARRRLARVSRHLPCAAGPGAAAGGGDDGADAAVSFGSAFTRHLWSSSAGRGDGAGGRPEGKPSASAAEGRESLTKAAGALHRAAEHGNAAAAARLIKDAGADPDAADAHGTTALHWAARGNHVGTVEVLVGAGAELDKADQAGMTALMGAAMNGSTEAVQRLLEKGADWRKTAVASLNGRWLSEHDSGKDALALAKREGKAEAAAALQAWARAQADKHEQAMRKRGWLPPEERPFTGAKYGSHAYEHEDEDGNISYHFMW